MGVSVLPPSITPGTHSGMFMHLPQGRGGYGPGDDDDRQLHQPSPAACGKRKMAELTAAEMLASTSAGKTGIRAGMGRALYAGSSSSGGGGGASGGYVRGIAERADDDDVAAGAPMLSSESLMDMEGEGAHVLFMLKDGTVSPRGLSPALAGMGGPRGASFRRDLSIVNPDAFYADGNGDDNGNHRSGAETPWEREMRALETRAAAQHAARAAAAFPPSSSAAVAGGDGVPYSPPFLRPTATTLAAVPPGYNSSLPASHSLSSSSYESSVSLHMSTLSEHRDFLRQVVALVDRGVEGVLELDHLLQTAWVNLSAGSGCGTEGTSMLTIATARLLNRQDSRGETVLMVACNPAPAAGCVVDDKPGAAKETDSNSSSSSTTSTSSSSSSASSSSASTTSDPPHTGPAEDTMLAVCEVLLRHGASARTADADGNTCLHRAAALGFTHVGRLLATQGCPVNAVNAAGDAAFHIAARCGHDNFLRMLVEVGTDCHLRNGQSRCALDLLGTGTESSGSRTELRRSLLTAEPRLRTLVLHHPDCLQLSQLRPSEWEGPDRLEGILRDLQDADVFPPYELEVTSQFKKASVELLGRAHSAEYIAFVDALSKQVQQVEGDGGSNGGGSSGGGDMSVLFAPQLQRHTLHRAGGDVKDAATSGATFSTGTLGAARRAAGAVAYAVDRVLAGRNRNAFCAVRPPGHHAGYAGLFDGATSCGFCVFNSVAAGALHALDPAGHNCPRVAIVDLDLRHGTGTEDIVRRYTHPSRLFFFSLHLLEKGNGPTPMQPGVSAAAAAGAAAGDAAAYFPSSGADDDVVHNIVNVPLWRSAGDTKADAVGARPSPRTVPSEAYRQAIAQRLIPSLRAFNPCLILLSVGFDVAEGGGGGGNVGAAGSYGERPAASGHGTDLQQEDFAWATAEVLKIADLCCRGRVSAGPPGHTHCAPLSHEPAFSFSLCVCACVCQVVSVLEGGYGPPLLQQHGGGGGGGGESAGSGTGAQQPPPPPRDPAATAAALASAVVAHVQTLSDPYYPSVRGRGAPTTGKQAMPPAAAGAAATAHGKGDNLPATAVKHMKEEQPQECQRS